MYLTVINVITLNVTSDLSLFLFDVIFLLSNLFSADTSDEKVNYNYNENLQI